MRFIYINGSINAGKTTVGRLLAAKAPKTVHIEVDHLRHFADCLDLDAAIPFCVEDLICLSQNWLRRGFTAVVTWPISFEDHDRIVQALRPLASVSSYTLRPSLEVALSDRGKRQLTERERDRIRGQYENAEIQDGIGITVDNSHQTPEETVALILSELSDS